MFAIDVRDIGYMASSSLSQESLDHEDVIVDISARRSRVRGGRSRCTAGSQQRAEPTDESRDVEIADDRSYRSAGWPPHRSAAAAFGSAGPPLPGHVNFYASTGGDHESPNRMRVKDKRSWQPGYLHKSKPPAPPSKDKRKLREKRRSSGLVHAQSAEVDPFNCVVVLVIGCNSFIITTAVLHVIDQGPGNLILDTF